MTNEELVKAIRGNEYQDNSLFIELWNQNAGMISKACGKFAGRLEKEDANQECYFAFLDAVKEYDPAAGATFANYLYKRCTWHLLRYAGSCGSSIRIPAGRAQKIRNYQQFTQQWYQMKGEQPDNWTLKMHLGLTAEDIKQLQEDMRTMEVKSLDIPITVDQEGGTLADLVQDPGVDAEAAAMDQLFIQERERAVWAAVDSLKPQESEAIRHCYQEGITYDQAGKVMGITGKQVRACVKSGLRKLWKPKHYKELRQFIELSREYSIGIRGSLASFNRTWTSSTERAAMYEMGEPRKETE